MLENNSWHVGQSRFQIHRDFTLLLQQLAALSGIGATLDIIVVVQLSLVGTTLAWIHGIGEVIALQHKAIDVVEDLRFAGVLRLERVHLDVFDSAGLQLVAVALGRTVMTSELNVSAEGGVL